MVEDGDLAEGMALPMLGRFRIARQHIQRHLLEVAHALFGKHHLDRADVGGAVKAPEGHVRHRFLSSCDAPFRRGRETRRNRTAGPAIEITRGIAGDEAIAGCDAPILPEPLLNYRIPAYERMTRVTGCVSI